MGYFEAGVTDRLWEVSDLVALLEAEEQGQKKQRRITSMALAAKQEQIRQLPDLHWFDLAMARRRFVELEKKEAQDKPYAEAICESIDRGYLNMLECILSVFERV